LNWALATNAIQYSVPLVTAAAAPVALVRVPAPDTAVIATVLPTFVPIAAALSV
jgi:hypothetical protein